MYLLFFLKVYYFFFRLGLSDKWSSGQFLEQKQPQRQLELYHLYCMKGFLMLFTLNGHFIRYDVQLLVGTDS